MSDGKHRQEGYTKHLDKIVDDNKTFDDKANADNNKVNDKIIVHEF